MNWPGDMINAPRATLAGSNRALIENHTGIIEFSDQRVRLCAPGGEIIVEGSGLVLEQVSPSSLMVVGRICAVTMPEGGEGHI